ncbi:hypothetical protein ACQUFY_27390 (plasmid) [Robbsia andropogonis]|uniref:hypothetical protein n=1 Tax=Robbsia andropogonis TaxID=28092 RepID=UPI002A69B6AE|nr:hypothetical protein [Robbsia andropogonis]
MSIFKYFCRGSILATGISVVLGACTSLQPGDKKFEQIAGLTAYGEINGIYPMESACKQRENQSAAYCQDQANWIWVGAIIGQRGMGVYYRVGLAVPITANARKGDIVEFTLPTDVAPRSKFVRLARHTTSEKDSSCAWVGSHVGTGGVECDGWHWNKDFPPFAD